MNEKTEALRNLFIDVANAETVTERQEESPGSLATESRVDDRVNRVIERMVDRYDFETNLDAEVLSHIVSRFFKGTSDEVLAEELDVSVDTIFTARMDMHLVSDTDRIAPFDLSKFRKRFVTDPTDTALMTEFSITEDQLDRYRRIIDSENEARRANYRYRDEFEELLVDGDLSSPLTQAVREDGLADATDGLESNVSF